MAKTKQRIVDVPRHDAFFFFIYLVRALYDINTASSRASAWFADPDVFGKRSTPIVGLATRLKYLVFDETFLLFEMGDKCVEVIGHNEGFRNEVEIRLNVPILHLSNVNCKIVFSCQFYWNWKMVHLLLRAKPFVEVWFPGGVRPQSVPVVPVSTGQPVELEQKLNKLWVTLEHLVAERGSIVRVVRGVVLFCELSIGWNLCLVYSFHKSIIVNRVSFFVFWNFKSLSEVKPSEVCVCYQALSLGALFKDIYEEVKELILRFEVVFLLREHPNVSSVQILGGSWYSCVRYYHTLPILSLDALMELYSRKDVLIKHGCTLAK